MKLLTAKDVSITEARRLGVILTSVNMLPGGFPAMGKKLILGLAAEGFMIVAKNDSNVFEKIPSSLIKKKFWTQRKQGIALAFVGLVWLMGLLVITRGIQAALIAFGIIGIFSCVWVGGCKFMGIGK